MPRTSLRQVLPTFHYKDVGSSRVLGEATSHSEMLEAPIGGSFVFISEKTHGSACCSCRYHCSYEEVLADRKRFTVTPGCAP